MKHLSEIDKKDGTVIMLQVENEIGMIEDARDYSKEANKLFAADIPQQFTEYLKKNKKTLHLVLLKRWEENGCLTIGSWAQLFGEALETDELFMAWSYARFVHELTQAGKKEYPLSKSYKLLHQLLPLLIEKRGKGLANGIWFDGEAKEQILERNDSLFTCRHDYTLGWSPQALELGI